MSRAIMTSAVVALAKRTGYSTATAAGKAGERGLKADSAAAAASSSSTMPTTSASPSAYSGSSSWVPDPVTGYYRPSNQSVDMDAAAMREYSLLSKQQKSRD